MKIDKEICHPAHPNHKLRLEYTEVPFNCDGCKEAGIGLKYKCTQCEFDLHKACAMAPPTITHPFYKKCEFRFYHHPPGQVMRICDACRDDILGFVYHCNRCGFDLHPCCANLPHILDDGEHNLYLYLKLSSLCHRCGGQGSGWSYRSDCKNYNLHVSCVKQLLVESWQAMHLNVDNNKVREIQTKIPRLKGTMQKHPKGREAKVKKYSQMASGAVSAIVSAILGDPSAIIAAVVGGLMPK
ncbi:hypothetical protein IFM89_031806 [Coptis chinensis]|uniref:Phorbol-ester/DAG-type domain-containing protein n=1 Tax=Coptis chinensis TaxID=261450 RepID=A0A835LPQ1_9MAGN|nr:hypothetical protein IFM89_031806 [Coptis chinensis]